MVSEKAEPRRTKILPTEAMGEYGPKNEEGVFKVVPEWSEAEVWGWMQTLPYATNLKSESFEFVNGGILADMTMKKFQTLGVTGKLIPRLSKDVNAKVVEIERKKIEQERATNAEEAEQAARKRQQSVARHHQEAVRMVFGCIPVKVTPAPVRRVFELAEGEVDERHEVRVQIFINSIGRIDSSSETWEADFWLRAVWRDDHLFEVRGSDDDFRADWDDPAWFQPRLEVVNSQDLTLVMEQKFVDTDEIYLEQRWRGTLHSDMDLHAFPYDQQKLHIDVESSFHATKFIKLVTAAEDAALYSHKCTEHSEFQINRGALDTTINKVEFVTEDDADFERYSLILHVSRRPGFYVGKVGLVNLICVVIGCSISFISPESPGDRLAINSTMFLTLVAFQFVIADQMPKISYFTLLDYLVLICYVIMIANVTQTIVQYNRSYAGVDPAILFTDDYNGFIALMAILFGAALLLSYYGIKSFLVSLCAVREEARKTHATE